MARLGAGRVLTQLEGHGVHNSSTSCRPKVFVHLFHKFVCSSSSGNGIVCLFFKPLFIFCPSFKNFANIDSMVLVLFRGFDWVSFHGFLVQE